MNTYSQRKQFPTNAAQQLAADVRAVERENQERRLNAIKRHEADKALEGTITREMLAGATAIRDASGWHLVIRCNKQTVTVEGPWGGTRLIPIEKIRETR